MTAGVFAELTRDKKSIVIMVTGEDFEINAAAQHLRYLTPLLRKSDPPGAVVCPATWSAVCQLSMTFTGSEVTGKWLPGPALRDWIINEFSWRHSSATVIPSWPEGLTPRPYQLDNAALIGRAGKFMLHDDPGPQPLSARVLTPAGWTTMGSVTPGDEITGTDGRPHRVLETYDYGVRPVYEVTFSDGSKTRADAEHRWAVRTYQMRARSRSKHRDDPNGKREYRFSRGERWLIKKTSELVSSGSLVSFIPVAAPAEFSEQADLPLHPYVLGALLGDGSFSPRVPKNGFVPFTTSHEEFAGRVGEYVETRKRGHGLAWGVHAGKEIHALGLANRKSRDKFIPNDYLRSSRDQRENLLRGLMDSDGRVNIRPGRKTQLHWSTTSPAMRDQFTELVRSLGGTARLTSADERKNNTCWLITVELPPDIAPFSVSYKTVPALSARTQPARAVRSVRPDGEERVKCLLVDTPDHLYITDDYIVTSNCGKTASMILGLKVRQLTGVPLWPMVVICPSWDVADVHYREITKWAPEWPEPVMYGGSQRGGLIKSDILLTTYATATLDAADASGPLVKLKAKAVVLDESHYARNEKALRTQAAQRIASKALSFVALTGTPVTRDTGDIFPTLVAMDPQSYPSRQRFVRRYLQTSQDEYQEKIEGLKPLAEPEFRAVLAGQMHRLAKADVLPQLPPKVYSVRRVELPGEWRVAYDGMASEMLAELPDGGELPVMSVLAQLTRLGQLASSAFDVAVRTEISELGQEVKKYDVTLKSPSWKVDALLGILAERPGQQAAVFANSRQLIDIAGAQCEKAGYRCGYLTGGQGKTARRDDIDAFQAGKLDVILATAGAGGLGITLTAAGTAVLLQRSWRLDESIQVEDRLHRYGSKHECIEIIDIIARDTVDSRVRALTREKGAQLASLVQDRRVVETLFGGLK
jgi:SNF2-related domain/Helicase conserved C-terminal domain/LAGLIDADG-like domain